MGREIGMPCNAEHASKLSRQYACSPHFLETDLTVGDETCLDRLAVPYPSVASHSSSAQHHEGPSLNSTSCEEDLHVLVPTKTYSTKSITSLTEEPIQIHSDTSLPLVISPDKQKPVLFQKKTPPFP